MLKNRGFVCIAVLTLALGIGANTAIFTLVHAVMLKSLPVANPGQLYRLGDDNKCCVIGGLQNDFSIFPHPFYQFLRDHLPESVEFAAFQASVMPLSVRRTGTSDAAQPFIGEFVSGNYFTMFGVRPAAGRTLAAADERVDAAPAAVMSYRTWRDRFGLDPAMAGSTITLNGLSATVVGIAPPGFFGDTLQGNPPDFWIPLGAEPALKGKNSLLSSPGQSWLYIIGRLGPSVRPSQVEARLKATLQQWLSDRTDLSAQEREKISKQYIPLTPGGSGVTVLSSRYGDGLRVLVVVSALVLLIACANIANLLLARTDQFQLAVRAALGATRLRLIRETLTEGLILALLGGLAALAVAYAGTRAILLLAFRGVDYVPIDPSPSLPILGFALLLSLLTGVIFTAAPAWIMSNANPIVALRSGSRFTAERSVFPRRSLVVMQIALSLVLLVGAGLLTESLWRLEHQSFGFETNGRLMVKVDPSLAGYTPDRLDGLYRQVLQRLKQIPGVLNASYSLYSPMSGNNWSAGISVEGRASEASNRDFASWDRVGPSYFETIGTRLLRGRTIDERDTPGALHVAVINQALMRKFFPNEDAIGKHLGLGDASHSLDFEIVGIVEDAKYQHAEEPAGPTFFLPLLQMGHYENESDLSAQIRSNYIHDIALLVSGRPENIERPVRQALAEIDPNLTVLGVTSFDEQLSRNFNRQRLIARLTMLYGMLALTLASVGLYGVAAYAVNRRTSEIGIRMALGANRMRVVRMVLYGALQQIGLGLALGIPAALAAGRALSSQLYGVSGYDPLILNAAALVLILFAIIAALVPARRAASIDPMRALRSE